MESLVLIFQGAWRGGEAFVETRGGGLSCSMALQPVSNTLLIVRVSFRATDNGLEVEKVECSGVLGFELADVGCW